ncbi:MAG: FAD-dependent thymidylate synthase [Firmicutes bacterium]|nr:FAD-dependent thymidylate synthase [Bacillota bacterium]
MHVQLLTYTPNPEQVVAAAARLCYSSQSGEEIAAAMQEQDTAAFIGRLRQMGHFSTFEHASFTFAIDGVSRALSHQLVRHRLASYSQKSQRYVKENHFSYVVPPSVSRSPQTEEEYRRLMEEIGGLYSRLLEQGVAAEDARYILPNATVTNLIMTMNARSLLNFFQLRCCNRAQWEIRHMAQLMRREVQKVAPALFAQAGPTCESQGICYEGEKCCKKGQVEIRQR